jgi:uncharacterized ubiquitin-like protein YukD
MNKDKVIELAMEEVGYTEGENNFNKYAPIAGLANNLPWCNSFIAAIFIQAGLKQAIPITAAVASTEAWGLKNDRLVKLEEAKRGDLILMDFTNSGRAQHIGLAINRYNPIKKTIHTVEGNTGEKSQANGEGVAYKTRSAKFIKCVIRLNILKSNFREQKSRVKKNEKRKTHGNELEPRLYSRFFSVLYRRSNRLEAAFKFRLSQFNSCYFTLARP